ncbi:MAG: hypothetical protein K2L03_08225, partial [Bacteroidales bacterium]|nr:hypothetical protein [Bacteroidales bacterium]
RRLEPARSGRFFWQNLFFSTKEKVLSLAMRSIALKPGGTQCRKFSNLCAQRNGNKKSAWSNHALFLYPEG